jgi:general secretion pathway protein D
MPKIYVIKSKRIQPVTLPDGTDLMWRYQLALRPACGRFAAIVLTAALAGCVTANNQGASQLQRSDIISQIREVDLQPRFPQRIKNANAPTDNEPQGVTYNGDGSPVLAQRKNAKSAATAQASADPVTTGALGDARSNAVDKGYEMNFENTPVATVAKAVLGDILGIAYTFDPRVQGTVSLSSGRPIPRKDLLFVLESALRVSNIALVRDGNGYRLVPSAEAVGSGPIDGDTSSPEAGFGISIVPLNYVSATTLGKLMENFAAKAGMVRADPSRNLIIIQGNAADRRAAIETALNFDADWMRGQSVGIYPVANSTLEPVIAELERIIDAGEGGLSQNVVKLQPIARQNAVLVVSRKPEYLKTVSTWITRLDKSGSPGTNVKVYRMRYGDARQTAALLNDIFLGGSVGSMDSPSNQLAPNGGVMASNGDRLNSGSTSLQNTNNSPTRTASASGAGPTNFDTRFSDASTGSRANSVNASAQNSSSNYGRGGSGPLLSNVRISADTVNNALLIYASQENYRLIERTVQQLDQPQLQVSIDATIAEVTLNDSLRYGVQFYLNAKQIGIPSSGNILNTAKDVVLSRMLPGFNFLLGTEAQPKLIIDALHAVSDVKILSTPSVVVIDNQFASLQVGDQIPIVTRTAQSVDTATAPIVNNIDYRNTGVILRVAPRINANGNVLLDVEQEISAVSDTTPTDSLTPTVSQRKVRSSIAVASGQTVLLGGLISERHDRGRKGLPGLDQIPGLGELFMATNTGSARRTELLIFIRPQIIRNGVDAKRVAEELRAKMRGVYPPPPAHTPTGRPIAVK